MDFELLYDELLDAIYAAAGAPRLWPDTLKKLNAALRSHVGGFFVHTHDNHFGFSLFEGFAPEMGETYAQHYITVNPWFTVPNLMEPGRILTDQSLEILSGHHRAYVDTEFYQDWARHGDMRHSIGGILRGIDGGLLNFTLFRDASEGHYTKEEIKLCARLSHHLMKATVISHQIDLLAKEKLDRDRVLDQLRLGIIVLNPQGRILHLNSYARQMLNEGDTLYEQKSQIKAKHAVNDKILKEAWQHHVHRSATTVLHLVRPGQSPLSVCILPAYEQNTFLGAPHRSTTLFISDPDDKSYSGSELIAKKWRLTPRESDFALLLAKGASIKQIAAELQLTQSSAQWYCKQIMQKVGVKRQAELCIKLATDIALLINY